MRQVQGVSLRSIAGAAILILGMAVAGCASDSGPKPPKKPLVPGGQACVLDDVTVKLTQYEPVALRAGTNWRNTNSVTEGQVYKPLDTAIMAFDGGYFSGQRFEAYLVVKDQRIVGIYLPTEKKFVAAKEPVSGCLTEVSR